MKHLLLLVITFLLVFSCRDKGSSKTRDSIEIVDTTEIEVEEEEISLNQLLSKILAEHKFDEAKTFIENNKIDINDFIEIRRGRITLFGTRILPKMTRLYCDSEITQFLLTQGSNPNLPSLTIFIPEYSGDVISEDFDIRHDDLSYYKNQNWLIKEFPLGSSLKCEDSTLFYRLIEAGANQDRLILEGAIKWSDTLLIKKQVQKEIPVNFVPNSNDIEILKLLIPITDGQQYGEIEYGEGGDMFESDLMNACYIGEKELVWFMLKTGANPNHCLPSNYVDIDENGYYPALTPLSIATKEYNENKKSSEENKDSKDAALFATKAQNYYEIVELLKKYGAEKIEKCMGP